MTQKPGEFELIEKYFAPLAGEGAFNLRDDAAEMLPADGHSLIITQDAVAEGIHFLPGDPPDLIAKKALRVNLSDLAAKGAVQKSFSLALGLGKNWDENWIAGFAKGLGEDCKTYDITLNGGDTFETGAGFVISVTAFGQLPSGQYVSRAGAGAGDRVFVTGTVGDAALGLIARQGKLPGLSQQDRGYLENRYLLPQPRTVLAPLIGRFASSSMDISDGLVGDLEKLCAASGISARFCETDIPLSNAAIACLENNPELFKAIQTGGDDYELLFSVPSDSLAAFEDAVSKQELQVQCLCELKQGAGVSVLDKSGSMIRYEKTGYVHSGEKN